MIVAFSLESKRSRVAELLHKELGRHHDREQPIREWKAIYYSPRIELHPERLLHLRNSLRSHQADIIQVPQLLDSTKKTQFVFDMDSTVIKQEVIDELARHYGVYDEISAVTQEAMEGHLDFARALRKRCSLLKGLSVSAFDAVYDSLQLNAGVEELFQSLRERGAVTCIFSGGFTKILHRFQTEHNITEIRANLLEEQDDVLTGNVVSEIVDKEKKREFLMQIQQEYGIHGKQIVAVGDGANDALMLEAAAIGIGFHAKDGLKKIIDNWIDFAPMDVLEALFES